MPEKFPNPFEPGEMPPPVESGLPPEEILSEKDLAALKEVVGSQKTAEGKKAPEPEVAPKAEAEKPKPEKPRKISTKKAEPAKPAAEKEKAEQVIKTEEQKTPDAKEAEDVARTYIAQLLKELEQNPSWDKKDLALLKNSYDKEDGALLFAQLSIEEDVVADSLKDKSIDEKEAKIENQKIFAARDALKNKIAPGVEYISLNQYLAQEADKMNDMTRDNKISPEDRKFFFELGAFLNKLSVISDFKDIESDQYLKLTEYLSNQRESARSSMDGDYRNAIKSKDEIDPIWLDYLRSDAKEVLEAEHYLDILTKAKAGIATETPPKEEKPAEELTDAQKLEQILKTAPENWGGESEVLPALEPSPKPEPSTFSVEEDQPGKEKTGLAEGPLRDANFKVEDALNNEEFLQFLSNYEDAREMDPLTHQREIEKRFDLYEAQKTLGKDLVDFYKREVGGKLDLPIDEEGEKAIAEAVRKEAMERPEELIKKGREKHGYESLKKELESYDQLLSAIGGAKNREEALRKLKAEEAGLKKKKMTQEWSVGFWKFINPETNPLLDFWFRRGMMTEEARTWQKDIQRATKPEREKLFSATDAEIEKLAEAGKKLEDWNEVKMRERFDELRREVFEKFEPTKALFGWLQKKTADTIESLLRKPKKGEKETSAKNIEDARKFIGKLRLGREKFGPSAFAAPEHFEAEAQEQMKNLVEALLHKHISEMKMTNKPLDGLMGKIRELVAQEKDPVKKGLMTTTMISSLEKAITNIRDNTAPPFKSADTAKLLLLQMAWHKLVESVRESN